MSWQDDARENAYFQAVLNARNMRAADKAVDTVDDLISEIGRALAEPTPPPKPQPSSGGSLGGLLALGALAGGAYLLSKVFGDSDNKTDKSTNQATQQTHFKRQVHSLI